jgi:hypothetical protein
MGRPLKIKKSATTDIGFNNPGDDSSPRVPAGELYFGQVGGDTALANGDNPVTSCRVKIGSVAEAEGYIIRQKGATKYLVADATGVTAGSFVTSNTYIITSLGNTDFTLVGGPENAAVGTTFVATGAGSGSGTVDTIGTCVLANKADASLAADEMTITYSDVGSGQVRIKRMTNKYAINFSDARVVVNYFNIIDDTVEKSGADKDTMTGGVSTIDVVQVENPIYG